jgi:choline-sulfatase
VVHARVLRDCHDALRRWLDPDEVDLRAKRRQRELLDGFGGREAALGRGDLGFTPAPGTGASFD